MRFVDFLSSRVPSKQTFSEKLISEDLKSNEAFKKHTVLFEIAPVCRDDLVVTNKGLRKFLGGM